MNHSVRRMKKREDMKYLVKGKERLGYVCSVKVYTFLHIL